MSLVEQTAPAQVVAKTKSYGNPGWKKGVSGNPNGRPTAARQRFTQSFLTDLAVTWQKQGKPCLDKLAKTDPATFVRVCASLIPKEVKLEAASPLSDLTEQELQALTMAAQKAVALAEAKQLEQSEQHKIAYANQPE
jgi:hypothetical protein